MSATQTSMHDFESAVLSLTLGKISLAISQQVIAEKLADIRHEQNLRILQKFLKVSQENEGGNEGVFFSSPFPSTSDLSKVEERVKKMATRLAMVSLRKWMLSGVDGLAETIMGDCYGAFEESLFKSIAKLILDAFDLEDLERFNSFNKLEAEYDKFYVENLLHLESDENPYELVAKGEIKFEGFPLLREQDVGHALEKYISNVATGGVASGQVQLLGFGFDNSYCFEEEWHGRFVEMARTVLLQYVPLAEDIRMHSLLDCFVCDCGCTLKVFLDEAVYSVVGILQSKEHCNDKLIKTIKSDLKNLIDDRFLMFHHASAPVASFAVYGSYGYSLFAEDVVCLIHIADARRRFENHRFISKHHILWASIRFTIYKELIENLIRDLKLGNFVEDLKLENLIKEPAARCPSYRIYQFTRAIAYYN
ncbi:hypothetical protein PTKIN_Ptkin01aG0330000 [Pterospermum kingtungense]